MDQLPYALRIRVADMKMIMIGTRIGTIAGLFTGCMLVLKKEVTTCCFIRIADATMNNKMKIPEIQRLYSPRFSGVVVLLAE